MERRILPAERRLSVTFIFLVLLASPPNTTTAQQPSIAIGARRELFVDEYLIEKRSGIELRLHHPTPRDVALIHDEPWEGTGCGYHSIFHDGERYRMYYKAWQLDVEKGKLKTNRHPLFCCYAESQDGIHWTKPKLGLHEFQGSRDNNIVLVSGKLGPLDIDAGHPAVFLDERPDIDASARFKAIVRSKGPHGLCVLQSPDGLHWKPLAPQPILSKQGAFDSQNLAFWDPTIGKYRAYWRIFTAGTTTGKVWKPSGIRAIRTAVSDNLVDWNKTADLAYEDSPPEHLYTNQVKPYFRAPHILVGFPTRYIERPWSPSMEALPELEHRRLRSTSSQRYGTAVTEGLLMTSRDGVRFRRWNEAFLRPGVERPGTWQYGHQYIAWHVVQTPSQLPGAPPELSLYATERYWRGPGTILRRYTLRLDGFVSAHATYSPGELVTRPLTFTGDELHLNFSTSAAGSVRVELQSADGKPIPGFELASCHELFGDTIDRRVVWKQGADVTALSGKPIRIRFVLQDADLFAFQFAAGTAAAAQSSP